MAAGHFFLGVTAGIAILAIPTAVVAPQLDIAGKIGAWVVGPGADARQTPGSELPALNRLQRGYVPGQPTPAPEAPPTLKPVDRPTPQPKPPTMPPEPLPTSEPAVA